MTFLVSSTTFYDSRFGIMATPSVGNQFWGIMEGMTWGADNEAFAKGFSPDTFFPWLERLVPYRGRCLFVVVPDVVGDGCATLRRYLEWAPKMGEWPLAYAAQDDSEHLPIPDGADCVFIGGTTEWKTGPHGIRMIRRAQDAGKHVHIGRINNWKRYRHFRGMEGSSEWTCDGTRNRFEGIYSTLAAWRSYMDAPMEPYLSIPERDSPGKSDGGMVGAASDDSERLPADRA